jgi:prepilin-type N-terminal cleavage/methylation domain-containing protein
LSKGFTLIEVLVASLLMCVFAASFTFLVNSGIRQVNNSRQLTRSIFISKSIMEEMRSKPFDIIFSYNNSRFDSGAGSITVSPAGNGLISIKISHKIELDTLRSRY